MSLAMKAEQGVDFGGEDRGGTVRSYSRAFVHGAELVVVRHWSGVHVATA